MFIKFVYLKSPLIMGAFLFFIFSLSAKASTNNLISLKKQEKTIDHKFPDPLKKILFRQQKNNKIAAALAFPFPFGVVGLHRVYLKTSPYVPIVYTTTAGGVFGIIPLIDCIILLTQKDISPYENNPQVIMWIKHTPEKE